MESPTRFRLAVASAALAGCAVGGVAFGPAFAGALQDDSTTSTTADESTTTTADDSTTTTTDDSTTDDSSTDPADCGPGGRGGHFGPGPGLDTAAEAIGIEADALRDAVRDGQTIAEVAEANGVDPATVIAAMVADAQEHLAQAVTDGRLTQEEADERSADLEQRITDLVNGELEFPGPGGHRGPHPDAAPTD